MFGEERKLKKIMGELDKFANKLEFVASYCLGQVLDIDESIAKQEERKKELNSTRDRANGVINKLKEIGLIEGD